MKRSVIDEEIVHQMLQGSTWSAGTDGSATANSAAAERRLRCSLAGVAMHLHGMKRSGAGVGALLASAASPSSAAIMAGVERTPRARRRASKNSNSAASSSCCASAASPAG